MSPHASAPPPQPRSSRAAVAVYAVCGVVGVLGLFAAAKDSGIVCIDVHSEVPAEVVDAHALPASALVGTWRANDLTALLLRADGTGALTSVGQEAAAGAGFTWSVDGATVETHLAGGAAGPSFRLVLRNGPMLVSRASNDGPYVLAADAENAAGGVAGNVNNVDNVDNLPSVKVLP